ncbi:MAG: glycosyltransferase family 2 protein, partial [Solirubrobacteraceae bacterium]
MKADKVHAVPEAAVMESREGIVDVVIVSADMGEMTLACVEELDDPVVAQIVVVDNAFDARAGQQREALEEHTTIVPLDAPHGFAAANN